MVSNQQFDRARRLALSLAGIELVERHRELLERRSQRLGIPSSAGLDSLLSAAEDGDTTATQRLLCLLTTKFTGFFRHPTHFDIAADHAFRVAREGRQARLWSAGAATGEEPYSLAMRLIELFECDEPPACILATDVDVEALSVARRGEYSEATLRGLEAARRGRFFHQAQNAPRWSVVPAARRLVEFRELNLANVSWPIQGPFDVIFCRNVLMYLEAGHRYSALEQIASLLAPDGLLMLDPAEHLGKAAHLYMASEKAVYLPRKAKTQRGTFHPTRTAHSQL